jgi:hypothetical protein
MKKKINRTPSKEGESTDRKLESDRKMDNFDFNSTAELQK